MYPFQIKEIGPKYQNVPYKHDSTANLTKQ